MNLDDLVERLGQKLLTNAQDGDWRGQLRALLEAALSELNLVTREEFDTQCAVLARTRKQLEQLQQRLDALETA